MTTARESREQESWHEGHPEEKLIFNRSLSRKKEELIFKGGIYYWVCKINARDDLIEEDTIKAMWEL